MRNLIIAALAFFVMAGCASNNVALSGEAQNESLISAGTLAFTGTCEMDVAADFSALSIYRKRAARDLTRGTISVDTAKQIQALADSARADLDAACPNREAKLDVARRDKARATLADIAKLLEKQP